MLHSSRAPRHQVPPARPSAASNRCGFVTRLQAAPPGTTWTTDRPFATVLPSVPSANTTSSTTSDTRLKRLDWTVRADVQTPLNKCH